MDDKQEDRLGMHVKCDLFLTNNATALAANANIATEHTALQTNIDNQLQCDSTATRDLTGYTEQKAEARTTLENLVLKVARACVGYYTANPNTAKKRLIDFTEWEVRGTRDSDLYIKGDQVHDVADPIKTLLTPFGVTAAEVDDVPVRMDAYKDMLQLPRVEEGVNKAAGEDVNRYQQTASQILQRLDGYLIIFKSSNPNLYSQWQTARSIDDSGGQGSTTGYTVQLYTINPHTSYSPFNTPADAGRFIYLRNLTSPPVSVCTTAASGADCADGYTLAGNTLYKDAFSNLGIGTDPASFVTFTNNTDEVVKVRAGLKNE